MLGFLSATLGIVILSLSDLTGVGRAANGDKAGLRVPETPNVPLPEETIFGSDPAPSGTKPTPLTETDPMSQPHDAPSFHDLLSGGTWSRPGEDLPLIDGYDPREDQLVVMFDGTLTPDPVVTIRPVGDTGDAEVLLDGHAVMRVAGGADTVHADDIELVETDLRSEAA